MPHDPYPDVISAHIIEEMVGEAVKITAPQPAGIIMKKPWIFSGIKETRLEFSKKIVCQCNRDLAVFSQDFIQVILDPFMESNSHGIEDLKPIVQR